MQGQRSRLIPVGESEVTELAAPAEVSASSRVESNATWLLMKALSALSQRALVALSAVEHLILGATVFALWMMIVPQPTQLQLIAGSIYSLFILAVIALRRK